MSNILTLLRLEFKSKFNTFSLKSRKSWVSLLASVGFYIILIYLVFKGATVVFSMFDKAGMAFESLIIFFTIMFIFLLVSGISSTVKVLYYKGDNLILMRFPVSGSQVFISKTLFLFISQLLLTAGVMVPFLLAYGTVVEVDSFFYLMTPVTLAFLVVMPFLLSNILAIPIMHLTNRIRNKFGLIIVLLSVFMTSVFAIYMIIFSRVVDYMQDGSFSVFSPEVVEAIKEVARYLIPFRYFADILYHQNLYISYPVLIMATAISLSGTIIIISKLYQKTLHSNVEIEGSAFTRKTKNKQKSVFRTLLNKEFIQVFRSINYSFQYFVLACSMPLMVYFCNSIAIKVGTETIGEQISVGMTILVMLIFATVITSFAATSVTREGNNFYHTKTMPVSIHKQLFAKFVMYLIVSVSANVICMVILVASRLMTMSIAWWVFCVVQSLSIAMTLRFMRYDIKKPTFNLSGEGEVVNNNTNTTTAILFGFIVAVAMGMFAMATAYILTLKWMMLACSILAGTITLYCFVMYFYKLKKTYGKIVK